MSDSHDTAPKPPEPKKARQTFMAYFMEKSKSKPTATEPSSGDSVSTSVAPTSTSEPAATIDTVATPDSAPAQAAAATSPGIALADALISPDIAEPDIAAALLMRQRRLLTDEQKIRFIQSTLQVPADYPFPSTFYNKKNRFLRHRHLSGERYGNFYYSPARKGVLCLPCVLFGPEKTGRGSSQAAGYLVAEPLCHFNSLTGRDGYLDSHLTRKYHEDALLAMRSFKQSLETGGISVQLKTQQAAAIARNRDILRAVIQEIETCGRLNLALRGHRDHGPLEVVSENANIDYTQGNLRAFIQKAAIRDPTLAHHLRTGPKNASYISPETQNRLVSAISSVMLRTIASPIREAGIFTLQADETSDVSRTEQLPVTIRYLDSMFEICESFVGFVAVQSATGASLAEVLMSKILSLGLDPQRMVAQAYDGASNMSGPFNGVQALIRARCPNAIYIHCCSHALNLVLSKASAIPEIRAALTGIQDACNYFKNSPRRTNQLKQRIQDICPEPHHSRLKQHCATRWVERHDSVFIFLELYEPLLSLLNENQERSLANCITDPIFLISVHILQEVLGVTKDLSRLLQCKRLDFISALTEISAAIQTFEAWRSCDDDVVFEATFSAAEKLYSKVEDDPDARIPMPRLAGRQRHRTNIAADSPKQYYKRAIWYPFIDSVLAEMRERFNVHSKLAFRLASILPSKCDTAQYKDFEAAVDMYASLLPDGPAAIQMEYRRWQQKWALVCPEERPTTIRDSFSSCEPSIYPTISALLKIYATIPVTTATAERSFSQLKLLKNYLRSTMGDDRLNGLAFMAIHKETRLNYDDVIEEYAREHNPRLKFA